MLPKFPFIFVFLCGLCASQDLSIKEEIIQDEDDAWVDPTDMFEWRPSKTREDPVIEKVERLGNTNGAVRPLSTRERNECREQRKELSVCQRKLRELQLLRHLVDDGGDEPCMDREFIYLRRLALNLVSKAKIGRRAPAGKAVKLEIYIPTKEISKLDELARVSDESCATMGNLEATLSHVLNRLEDPLEELEGNAPMTKQDQTFFENANSFWLIPLLAIAGTLIFNSVYNNRNVDRH